MVWQATGVVRRLARGVGVRPRPLGQPGGPGAVPPDVAGRAAGRARTALPPSEVGRFDAVLAEQPDAADALRAALATGYGVQVVEQLASRWATLAPRERAAVLDPVRSLARAGRQTDPTTCGSASLTMLAATGDPVLALWLATGWLPAGARPGELRGAGDRALARLTGTQRERRFAAVQAVVKRRTCRDAVLGLPWPAALGTPPWGAAREARHAGVRFTPRMLDDTDRADLAAALGLVRAAVTAGVPVPLYSGGDSRGGLAAVLPRHVVLAVDVAPDGLVLWEPSAGRLTTLRTADALAGRGAAALGGWDHLTWAVLPVA